MSRRSSASETTARVTASPMPRPAPRPSPEPAHGRQRRYYSVEHSESCGFWDGADCSCEPVTVEHMM